MLPGPGELLHFSEDPSIRAFAPHVEHYFAGVRERGLEFSGIRMGNVGIGPGGPFPTRR